MNRDPGDIEAEVRTLLGALTANSDPAAFQALLGLSQYLGECLGLSARTLAESQSWGDVAGVPGLSPRDASAALALVTAATEKRYEIVGFTSGGLGFRALGRLVLAGATHGLTPLAISPRQRLDDAIRTVTELPFGGTDCALPMRYAQARER